MEIKQTRDRQTETDRQTDRQRQSDRDREIERDRQKTYNSKFYLTRITILGSCLFLLIFPYQFTCQ